MISFFRNMKIAGKIAASFGLIGMIFVGVIALYQNTLSQAESGYQNVIDEVAKMKALNQELDIKMLEGRRAEKDFLLRKNMDYVESHQKIMEDAAKKADSLIALEEAGGHVSDVEVAKKLKQLLSDYSKAFVGVAKAEEYKGLDEESGLQGSFRKSAHELESSINKYGKQKIMVDYLTLRRHEKDYLLRGDDKYVKAADGVIEEIKSDINAGIAINASDKIVLLGYLNSYGKAFHNLVAQDAEIAQSVASMRDTVHAVEPIVEEGVTKATLEMEQITEEVRSEISNKSKVVYGVTAMAIVLTIVFSLIIARSISVPLRAAVEVSNAVALGDLSKDIEVVSRDEVGQLLDSMNKMVAAQREKAELASSIAEGDLRADVTPKSERDVFGNAFRKMVEGLRNIITEIKEGSTQMNTAAVGIAAASEQSAKNNETTSTGVEEVTATMHEMSVNIQNVAKNSMNQSSSVEQTSSSIEQMVSSIKRVADNTQHLVELSHATSENVVKGLDAVNKSVSGNEEINEAIKSTAGSITSLGGRAESIGKIVDVIDDIAEQTNLLALNAAIEAARAGEQGLGFAVVAEEVRKLAERSAKSTKEIAELISGIQRETNDAVKLMDSATAIVSKGVELSREVSETLKAIETSVTEVDRFSKEIGAATQEQSGGSTQIAQASESLRELSKEIRTAMEEQASSAEQTGKTMEQMREMIQQNASSSVELAASADQLRGQAGRFLDLTSRFRLNGEGEKAETGHYGNGKKSNGGNGSKSTDKLVGVA